METLHVFTVRSLPATNMLPSRTKIISQRYGTSIVVPNSDSQFDQSTDSNDRGRIALVNRGYDIVGVAEGQDCSYVISRTFKPL